MQAINSGDTAWVLASAGLVLFMTPGLAVFYGGMVRAKSALNMMSYPRIAWFKFGARNFDSKFIYESRNYRWKYWIVTTDQSSKVVHQ